MAKRFSMHFFVLNSSFCRYFDGKVKYNFLNKKIFWDLSAIQEEKWWSALIIMCIKGWLLSSGASHLRTGFQAVRQVVIQELVLIHVHICLHNERCNQENSLVITTYVKEHDWAELLEEPFRHGQSLAEFFITPYGWRWMYLCKYEIHKLVWLASRGNSYKHFLIFFAYAYAYIILYYLCGSKKWKINPLLWNDQYDYNPNYFE